MVGLVCGVCPVSPHFYLAIHENPYPRLLKMTQTLRFVLKLSSPTTSLGFVSFRPKTYEAKNWWIPVNSLKLFWATSDWRPGFSWALAVSAPCRLSDPYPKGTVNLSLEIIPEKASWLQKYLCTSALFLSTTLIFWLSTSITMLLLELESTVT